MAEYNPVVLRIFTSGHHAQLVKNTLEANGIRTFVTGDQLADVLSIYGNATAKVELLVDASHFEEASQIIEEMPNSHQAGFDRWGLPGEQHWQCPKCNEANGQAFEECWNCQSDCPEDAVLIAEEAPSVKIDGTGHIHQDMEPQSTSPYRAPVTESEPAVDQSQTEESGTGGKDIADRALRASIFGLVFPVPLAFYGCYLCIQAWGSSRKTGKLLVATVISLPAVLGGIILLLTGLQGIRSAF